MLFRSVLTTEGHSVITKQKYRLETSNDSRFRHRGTSWRQVKIPSLIKEGIDSIRNAPTHTHTTEGPLHHLNLGNAPNQMMLPHGGGSLSHC